MLILPFIWLFVGIVQADSRPSSLRILDFDASAPIDSEPRFSWINNFGGVKAQQHAYQIVVSDSFSTIWDSGKVRSEFQVGVPYKGPALEPATRHSWKVRAWGGSSDLKHCVKFSSPMSFTTGFFSLDQWSDETHWIAARQDRVGLAQSSWISADTAVHKSFTVAGGNLVSAQTSVTATSPFTLSVNGVAALNTSATWSMNVTDIDLKPYIKPGKNTISISAPGGAEGVILRSEVRTHDSELILVATDDSWSYLTGGTPTVVAPYYEAPWSTWKILTTGGTVVDSPQMMRREFNTPHSIVSATLFITGLGQFQPYMNGAKIGPFVTNQAWTDFDFRTTYTTYDVTNHILEGAPNVLGVELANGWFSYQTKSVMQHWGMGEAGIEYIKSYGIMRTRCELHIKHADGATEIVSSDDEWKSSPSAWTFTNVYGSEDCNFQLEQPGWTASGFDDQNWTSVNRIDPPEGALRSQRTPSIKAHESFAGKVHSSGPRYVIYDIGTNINGQVEITTIEDRSLTYDIVPGEMLAADRVSAIGNKKNDTASGSYITYSKVTTAGTGEPETFRQTFSTVGFRYLEIQAIGSDALPEIANVTGRFVYADAPSAGSFKSSNDTYKSIYAIVRQTLLSNFISIHTDYPTFEKLGWQEVVATLGRSYSGAISGISPLSV